MNDLDRTLVALHNAGVKLDSRAQKLVEGHYKQLDLTSLLELLHVATDLDSRARREGELPALMAEFNRLTAVLGPPPPELETTLRESVRLGADGVGRLINLHGPNSFSLSAAHEADLVARSTERFRFYWRREAPQFAQGVQSTLEDGLRRGMTREQLERRLYAQVKMSRNRAYRIARNEVGTAQGFAAQETQESLGVESYTWSTAKDPRVRPEHRVRHGKVFRWDSPPDDGPPGVPIFCRCVAIPVLQ